MSGGAPWLAAKLLLLALFAVLTNPAAANRVGELVARDEPLLLLLFLGIWLACATLLVLAAFLPQLWLRLLWALVLAVSAFAVDAYHHVAAARLTLDDALVLWVERAHLGDAVGAYGRWLLLSCLHVGLGVLALGLPPLGPRRPAPGASWLARLGWAPLLPFALLCAILVLRGGRGMAGMPSQWSGLTLFTTAAALELSTELPLAEIREASAPEGPRHARHVVLIIDESVRGDFVESRPPARTTPYLASLEPPVADFGRSVAAGNCSNSSNAVIRLGVARDDLSAGARLRPSVWAHAHAAGYRTVYIDGQRRSGGLQNWMTLRESALIDEFVQFDEPEAWRVDGAVARRIRRILASPEPHFVLANKHGAHFPYERSYPESATVFTPHASGGDQEALLNSYRNAIRWSVDGFFRELLDGDADSLDGDADLLDDAVLLYTSDHGQNLGARVPHCNTSRPHPSEALVPLLILSGVPELRDAFAEAARHNRGRATHFEIFPTVLALFGYAPERVRREYGPGLLDPLEPGERAFTVGPVLLHFGREARWERFPPELLRDEPPA